jgi:hypothetical protein
MVTGRKGDGGAFVDRNNMIFHRAVRKPGAKIFEERIRHAGKKFRTVRGKRIAENPRVNHGRPSCSFFEFYIEKMNEVKRSPIKGRFYLTLVAFSSILVKCPNSKTI